MHRTTSIDYAAVLIGEIVCKLDNGEEKTVRTVDFITQQGTNHQWINRTDQICRILFVMTGVEKIVCQMGKFWRLRYSQWRKRSRHRCDVQTSGNGFGARGQGQVWRTPGYSLIFVSRVIDVGHCFGFL